MIPRLFILSAALAVLLSSCTKDTFTPVIPLIPETNDSYPETIVNLTAQEPSLTTDDDEKAIPILPPVAEKLCRDEIPYVLIPKLIDGNFVVELAKNFDYNGSFNGKLKATEWRNNSSRINQIDPKLVLPYNINSVFNINLKVHYKTSNGTKDYIEFDFMLEVDDVFEILDDGTIVYDENSIEYIQKAGQSCSSETGRAINIIIIDPFEE